MPFFSLRRWRQPVAGRLLLLFTVPAWTVAAPGRADVIVLANRTRDAIAFQVTAKDERPDPIKVAAGDLTVLSLRGPCELTYDAQGRQVGYHLDANAAYMFVRDERGQVDVSKIDLGGNEETFGGRALTEGALAKTVVEIPLEIFVDNYELTTRAVWEARLRKRIERVSSILERCCRVRLKIANGPRVRTRSNSSRRWWSFSVASIPSRAAWPSASLAAIASRRACCISEERRACCSRTFWCVSGPPR
jgi:hypothetical protein